LQAIEEAETDLKAEPSAPDSAAMTIEPATAAAAASASSTNKGRAASTGAGIAE
jgi:hypothetical protein